MNNGLNKSVIDSLAVFIYNSNFPKHISDLSVYTEWANKTEFRLISLDDACELLDHIHKLRKVPAEVLYETFSIPGFSRR